MDSLRPQRVLVIGGGPSGLVSLKTLLSASHAFASKPIDPVLFEVTDRIGGTFRWRSYPDAELVSSKQLTCFSDFRLPLHEADHVSLERYVQYLEDYSSNFNLYPLIKTGHRIVRVERVRAIRKPHTYPTSSKSRALPSWASSSNVNDNGKSSYAEDPEYQIIPEPEHVGQGKSEFEEDESKLNWEWMHKVYYRTTDYKADLDNGEGDGRFFEPIDEENLNGDDEEGEETSGSGIWSSLKSILVHTLSISSGLHVTPSIPNIDGIDRKDVVTSTGWRRRRITNTETVKIRSSSPSLDKSASPSSPISDFQSRPLVMLHSEMYGKKGFGFVTKKAEKLSSSSFSKGMNGLKDFKDERTENGTGEMGRERGRIPVEGSVNENDKDDKNTKAGEEPDGGNWWKGKRVMVLGCGETSMDISHFAVIGGAEQVVLCHRGGFLSFPKVLNDFQIFGHKFSSSSSSANSGVAIDGLITNLFETAYVHPWIARSRLRWFVSDFVIKRVLWFLTGTTAGCNQWVGGLPPERLGRAYVFLNKSTRAQPYLNLPYQKPRLLSTLFGTHYLDGLPPLPPNPTPASDPSSRIKTPALRPHSQSQLRPFGHPHIELAPWPESISKNEDGSVAKVFWSDCRDGWPEAERMKGRLEKVLVNGDNNNDGNNNGDNQNRSGDTDSGYDGNREGDMKMKKEEWKRVGGQDFKPDCIVYATGYQQDWNWLGGDGGGGGFSGVGQWEENDDDNIKDGEKGKEIARKRNGNLEQRRGQRFKLYPNGPQEADVRGICCSWDPKSIGFIGFLRPGVGAIPPMAEQQAMFFALLLQDRLPSSSSFRSHPHAIPSESLSPPHYHLLSSSKARIQYGVDYSSYMATLAKDMGAAPGFGDLVKGVLGIDGGGRWGWKVAVAYCFGASFVTFYRLVGPFKSDMAPEISRTELWETVTRRKFLGNLFMGVIPMVFYGIINLFALFTELFWVGVAKPILKSSGSKRAEALVGKVEDGLGNGYILRTFNDNKI